MALRNIKRYQKSTDLLMQKLPVQRVIRMVAQEQNNGEDIRFQASAVMALHEAVESYLAELFANANKIAIHGKRVTLEAKDLLLAQDLCK